MKRLGWLVAVLAIVILVFVSQVALQYAASRSVTTDTATPPDAAPTMVTEPVATDDPLPTDTVTAVPPPSPSPTPTGVTATPLPQTTRSSSSSLTPSPLLTPSSTLPAAERLAQALHQQEIGDTAQARRGYVALIQEDPGSPTAVEARYRLAESYLLDRAYSEAATAWRDYLSVAPEEDEEWRRWATFMLGRAYEGAGAFPQAIEAYETYLADLSGEPPLVVEANERIAGIEMRRGDVEAAVERYVALLYIAPPSEIVWLRETLAQAYLSQGEGLKAVAQYETLLEGASGGRQAQYHYLIARALDSIGEDGQVFDHLRKAVEAETSSPFAYNALLLLVQAGQPVDEYLRGLTDYYAAAYTLAVAAFERILADDPSAEMAGAATYFLGRSQYGLGQFTSALATFDRVIRVYPSSSYWDDAWFSKAATQTRLGDVSAARSTYQTFARRYPHHARAAEALWEATELLKLLDDMESAAAEYLDLSRLYPDSSLAAQSLYWAGIALYRLGDYDAAAEAMRDLATNHAGSGFDSAAFFWWGKSLVTLGDAAGAEEVWTALQQVEPDGWYMLRAEAVGAPLEPVPSPSADNQEIAEAWLRGWTLTNLSVDALRGLPAAIAEDDAFLRGREFLAVGLTRQGLAELEGVRDRWVDDPIAMYQLTLALRDLGAYRLSVLSAARLIALSPVKSIRQAPGFIMRLTYPTYYGDVVDEEATGFDLDPWLFFALIRQESLFDASATSIADARGLTQVIPDTGDWVASQIGWRDFDTDDLYRPYVSVKFGGYYLSRALVGFEGDLLMALAGYNGGPGNATAWRRRSGPDDDLFVATIGAFESRTYVRSVMAQYAIYRWLYGDG